MLLHRQIFFRGKGEIKTVRIESTQERERIIKKEDIILI